jgi:hypothetical protein
MGRLEPTIQNVESASDKIFKSVENEQYNIYQNGNKITGRRIPKNDRNKLNKISNQIQPK